MRMPTTLSLWSLRRILIVFFCLWLLALLHSSSTLFRLEEELSQQPQQPQQPQQLAWKQQGLTKSTTQRGRSFSESRNVSNGALLVGHVANLSQNLTWLKEPPRKPPKHVNKPMKRRKSWLSFSEPTELNLPKPVFVMGFPKAGTSSIFTFFHSQHLKSQHWYCCKPQSDPQAGGPALMAGCLLRNLARQKQRPKKNHTFFEGCGADNIEVFTELNGPRRQVVDRDTRKSGYLLENGTFTYEGPGARIFFPQHFYLQEIHEDFPNATWILNIRPVETWIQSVMKWGDDLDVQFANEYYMQHAIQKLPTNDTEMVDFLKTIYLEHHNLIREFVEDHPSHALIEVNITDDGAGQVLADAFGLDASHWTHKNRNEKGRAYYWQHPSPSNYGFLGSTLWWIFMVGTTGYLGWTVGVRLA